MKPRLFIGSSTENLEIANAVQASLEYDAECTVWNQGIFNLSSGALDDLLKALDNFDFAIFIFQPNDITVIRDNSVSTVRDNVIFELGLFMGRLGKDHVYYLVDRNAVGLHLPTDLIGVKPGYYDSDRSDNNLLAAIGPFCHEVRGKLKSFILENLNGLKDETDAVKKIVVSKTPYWEFDLAVELLNSKLAPINTSFEQLERDMVIQRKKSINYQELYQFVLSSLETYMSIGQQFVKALEEMNKAFGPPGEPGNALEIKGAIDHIVQISKELLAWEYDLNALIPPNGLETVKSSMKGWSRVLVDSINTIAPQTAQMVIDDKKGIKATPISFDIKEPDGMSQITEPFVSFILKHNITDLQI